MKADGTAAAAGQLEASAVSGQVPPAGPQWLRGLRALEPSGLAYDKPLCASLDGFTLHAATRAGARDTAGREACFVTCFARRSHKNASSRKKTALSPSRSNARTPTAPSPS